MIFYLLLYAILVFIFFFSEIFLKCHYCKKIKPRHSFSLHRHKNVRITYKGSNFNMQKNAAQYTASNQFPKPACSATLGKAVLLTLKGPAIYHRTIYVLSPSPRLMDKALSIRFIKPLSRQPTFSFNLRLSIVLSCSSSTTESLLSP